MWQSTQKMMNEMTKRRLFHGFTTFLLLGAVVVIPSACSPEQDSNAKKKKEIRQVTPAPAAAAPIPSPKGIANTADSDPGARTDGLIETKVKDKNRIEVPALIVTPKSDTNK